MIAWRYSAPAVLAAAALVAAMVPAAASEPLPDGSVATVSIDSFDGPAPASRTDRALLTADGRVLPMSARTRTGVADTSAAVRDLVAGSTSAGTPAAAPHAAASATVARSVSPIAEHLYLVAIQDPGTTGAFTTTRATQIANAAAAYWKREARGAISGFSVQSTTLDVANSCSDGYEQVWTKAAAAYPDVDFTKPGNHVVAFSPLGCYDPDGQGIDSYDYAGVANVGSGFSTGGYVQVVADQWGVLAHELGHHFGLGHADLALQTYAGVKSYEYYGLFGPQALQLDDYAPGALDGAWRAQLGVPGESAREKVVPWNAAPTLYTLAPLTATSGTTSLVLRDEYGDPAFWLDYRSGAAADAATFYASDPIGKLTSAYGDVSFRRGVTVSAPFVPYPDDAPDTYDLATVAFPAANGSSFHAAGGAGDSLDVFQGDVRIKVVSTSASGAQVLVSYAAHPQVATKTTLKSATVTERAKAKVAISVRSSTQAAAGQVAIYQDGRKVATRTLVGGKLTYTTAAGLTRGTHTFTVRYAGTPAFGASSASVKVVAKDASKVSLSAKKVRKGASSTVTARISSDVTATGTVKLYKGSTYVGRATVSKGRATFHLPKSWRSKAYTLTAKYSGSSRVAASVATKKLTIH
ncbi:MAG: Ig-like domain repeat protein [Brevundimonas sp.]